MLLELTGAQKALIGQKIWYNECKGTVEGLTSWNQGEEFPSLGIGHFIWYPANFQGPFEESFPLYVKFAVQQGQSPPRVARLESCPWPSRGEFEVADLSALRQWLAETVSVQTEFVVARSRAALPKLLGRTDEPDRIRENYEKVASTPNGTYALVDYVNFKGEGTNPKEAYQGHGWGLLQVLGEMNEVPAGPPAAYEFGEAAKRCLDRRIANSPPARGEERWRRGWHKRCDTYGMPISLVSREQWGSTPRPMGDEWLQQPERLVVHHAGVVWKPGSDPVAKVKNLQTWGQREKGWPDLPYHYLIAPDGRVFQGRPERFRPESNTRYDLDGVINVQLFGDFNQQQVTPEQSRALVETLAFLCLRHGISPSKISDHQQEAPGQTTCPGEHLHSIVRGPLRGWVRRGLGLE